MLFSNTTEYGLYLLLYLSRREIAEVSSLGAIASDLNLSPEDTQKAIQALAAARLIHLDTEHAGCCRLGQPLSRIPFVTVLDALEPPPQPFRCIDNPQRLCVTYRSIHQIREGLRRALRGETIGSLLGPARPRPGHPGEGEAQTLAIAHGGDAAICSDAHKSCCECEAASNVECDAAVVPN